MVFSALRNKQQAPPEKAIQDKLLYASRNLLWLNHFYHFRALLHIVHEFSSFNAVINGKNIYYASCLYGKHYITFLENFYKLLLKTKVQ